MNAKALVNSLGSPQLIRARQTALSFCALLDAKKEAITRELTVPQLISTVFIDSPSVTSIIAPKLIECIEKRYISADCVLENILKLSFKSLSPFSIEHITQIAVSCIFTLGKDPSSPLPPTLHPLAELISGCPEAWEPLVTKALPALALRGLTESFAVRWLWPYFRGVFLNRTSLAMYRSKLYTFTVSLAKNIRSNTLIEKMISLVPLYDTSVLGDDYTFAIQAVTELADISTLSDDAKTHLFDAVLGVMCSINSQGSEARRKRLSYSPFALALRRLVEADPSLLGEKRPSAPTVIAMLLSTSSEEETNSILSTVEVAMTRSERWCPYATAVLRGALVELQCSSTEEISKHTDKFLHRAKCTYDCNCREVGDTKYAKHPLLITLETMHRELCQTWKKSDAKEILSWAPDQDDDGGLGESGSLDNINSEESTLSSSQSETKLSCTASSSSSTLFTLFFRPFLMHPEVSVRDAAMEVAVRRRDVDELPLLTAVLHMLQEGAEDASLKTIVTVAHFARCKAAITPVLSALVPLAKRPALFPSAIRALELVWELQPRTASVLFSRLRKYSPQMENESRFAIAQTVRDVARVDPAAAASELMHVILGIIRNDKSDVCVSLALEALDSITDTGGAIVDFSIIDGFVRTQDLLGSGRAPRVIAAAVRLLGNAAARKAAVASRISSREHTEIPEEDAAAIRSVIERIAPFRSSKDGLVRAAVFDIFARLPVDFTAEFLSTETVCDIFADDCFAARAAGLSFLAKLGATESSFRGATATTTLPTGNPAATQKKEAKKSGSSSVEKARAALDPLAKVIAEEWAEDSRTGSNRGALCGALVWAGGLQSSGEEELWDSVGDVLDSLECGNGWVPRLLMLSALSAFARRVAPVLITDSDATNRLVEMLDDRASESPARGEVCALLAGAFAAALPLSARSHAATLAQMARRWIEEESPEAQFLCGCRVAVACCEGVLLGGSDFAAATTALVNEYTTLITDDEYEEWDRGGASVGLSVVSSFVAEAAVRRSKAEGVAALLPAYKALHAALVDNSDEYDSSSWWCWLCAGALSSVALALLELDCTDPATSLFEESLSAVKSYAVDEEFTQWQAVSCMTLARSCSGLYAKGKLSDKQRIEALDAMLAASTSMNDDECDADDTVRGGWLILLAATANSVAAAANKVPSVDGALALVKGLVEDADSLLSQSLCLDVFVACANILGAGVAGAPKPWPLADGPLNNAFAKYTTLDDTALSLIQTLRDSFESDEVGVAKAATWAIGALCRPLPQVIAAESSGTNSSIASAAPSSSAFSGMPVAKLAYETLVEGAKQEAFTTVSTALTYLSRTRRLPNIRWDKLLSAIYEFNNDEVKRRCLAFIQSRVELANMGVGSLARDVAMTCLPLYSAWLQPSKFTMLPEPLQEAGDATLGPLAAFSYADFHNCVIPLLHTDIAKIAAFPALLSTLRECTQMKCDVPDKMIDEYEGALLKAFNAHPSPLSVAGPRATIDARSAATLRAVAGALFHIYERKGTINSAIQNLLSQPLIKGPCASPSKIVLAMCGLVMDDMVPIKALGACRKWCGDVDRRNATLHITAVACAAQVATTILEKDGDKTALTEDVLDTLLAGAPGTLALPTMLEGALSTAPFQILCRGPHAKRLAVAASAGRSSDCLLNGYLPLELAKATASARGGKADKVLGKVASLAAFCSKEESIWEVPMARMLFSAIISSSDPRRHIDNQLMKWL